MKKNIIELFATVIVLMILIGTPMAISNNSPWKNHNGKKLINLTAVAAQGIWTEDKVDGSNYWNTNFKRANLVLTFGEEVILRFTSVDVTHTFYAPEANLGPIIVEAGKYYDIPFTPKETGRFTYYCTTVCGLCHFFMQGNIFVVEKGKTIDQSIVDKVEADSICPLCKNRNVHELVNSSFVQHGAALYKSKGCFLCHGEAGAGGIKNPNYALINVPELNTLANKLKLSDKHDAESVIKMLETGADLERINDNPPFPTFNRFYAQYISISNKIKDGSPIVQKLDSSKYLPPLWMPSWEHQLTPKEINEIIAYMINIFDWDKY